MGIGEEPPLREILKRSQINIKRWKLSYNHLMISFCDQSRDSRRGGIFTNPMGQNAVKIQHLRILVKNSRSSTNFQDSEDAVRCHIFMVEAPLNFAHFPGVNCSYPMF